MSLSEAFEVLFYAVKDFVDEMSAIAARSARDSRDEDFVEERNVGN